MRGKECFPAFYGILVNELMPDVKEQGIEMPLVEGEKAASLGENSKTRSSRENCATKQELSQIPCGKISSFHCKSQERVTRIDRSIRLQAFYQISRLFNLGKSPSTLDRSVPSC